MVASVLLELFSQIVRRRLESRFQQAVDSGRIQDTLEANAGLRYRNGESSTLAAEREPRGRLRSD